MNKKIVFTLSIVALLFTTFTTQASLIRDDANGWTIDSDTGLQWLHLDETVGLSWGEVESGAGGWWGDSWRYASNDQITGLWDHADVTYHVLNQLHGLNVDGMEWFFDNVMDLTSSGASRYVRGVSADQVVGDPTRRYTPYVYHAIMNGTGSFYLTESGRQFNSTDSASDMGHWLVRSANVPEPSTLALFLLGGVLLAVRGKRARHV
ncbi:MAG: hypothetical protein DIZ78_14895 [endosymbiont of Escarpia spicata]|uniref:Ice-binding protein C-terminal domain-containing protein n=1 Tax=endosymbiont of Escarpia spicata TaxID=2200908 RepID=A0A370DEI0_9GAMM|nr:MAG: hypothetical protein DIZ78_14895 [endosymbiont of Escarpia spicata]